MAVRISSAADVRCILMYIFRHVFQISNHDSANSYGCTDGNHYSVQADKLICELKEISASVILNSISIRIFCDLLHKSERIDGYGKIIERKGIVNWDSSKRRCFVSSAFYE